MMGAITLLFLACVGPGVWPLTIFATWYSIWRISGLTVRSLWHGHLEWKLPPIAAEIQNQTRKLEHPSNSIMRP